MQPFLNFSNRKISVGEFLGNSIFSGEAIFLDLLFCKFHTVLPVLLRPSCERSHREGWQGPGKKVTKGLCHEMDIFLKTYKIESVLFVCALMV
jgi:hypothetical protein